MSEAKRFIVPLLQMWDCTGQPPALPSEQVVVISSEFDRVTAERDALQVLLTAADERADSLESGLKWESDRNALLLASLTEAEDMLSITSLEAGRRIDQLEGLLFSLPEDLKALSGCENTAGVYACIDYIEQCIAGLQQVTVETAALD